MCYFKFTAKILVPYSRRQRSAAAVPHPPSPVKKESPANPTKWFAGESEEIPATVQFSAKPETERRREFLSWWGKVDSNHRSQ